MAISKEVQMLLDRMDSHPEEFINPEWDPVQDKVATPFENTRWENILSPLYTHGKESLFLPEETDAITARFKSMVVLRVRECIIKELVMQGQLAATKNDTQRRLPLHANNSRF